MLYVCYVRFMYVLCTLLSFMYVLYILDVYFMHVLCKTFTRPTAQLDVDVADERLEHREVEPRDVVDHRHRVHHDLEHALGRRHWKRGRRPVARRDMETR